MKGTIELTLALRPNWPGQFGRRVKDERLVFAPGESHDVTVEYSIDDETGKIDVSPIVDDIGSSLVFASLDHKGRLRCQYDVTNEFTDARLSGSVIDALHKAVLSLQEIADETVDGEPEGETEGDTDVLVVESQIPKQFHEALLKVGLDTLSKIDEYRAKNGTLTGISGIKEAGEKQILASLELHTVSDEPE